MGSKTVLLEKWRSKLDNLSKLMNTPHYELAQNILSLINIVFIII